MFDNARAALRELSDDGVFERVAVYVLRARHAELRLTGPSGDLGRDGFGRRLFGAKDEVVVMTSLERRWTAKLGRELDNIKSQPRNDRPRKAIFVTSQSADQKTQTRYKSQAHTLGVALEVFDINELVLELDGDALRWVAENELGVRPRQPRVLVAPPEFFEQMSRSVPGVEAAVVGRDDVLDRIKIFVANQDLSAPRVLVVAGRGGVGKTRVAIEGAFQAATTLIARTAAHVDGAALTAVPLDDPVVLVVDDAHRSRDLSGLAAMVGDSRYDRVKIILTVRPGLRELVLEDAGLGLLPCVSEELRGLDRADIDAIVVGHGINDPEFVRAVITLAEGSPLVAHAACELAATQHSFSWGDAASVLEDYVVKRLLATAADETRAAAVALALLSSAEGGGDLARLAGAVTSLPADTERLDTILADLADIGLVDAGVHGAVPAISATFTVRPHLAAPLLVAQALPRSARVRLKVEKALPVLGRAALRSPGDGIDGSVAVDKKPTDGVLGIGTLSNGSLTGTWLNTSVLASQLQVLAQAAVRASDATTAAQLDRAVRELLPEDADADVWRDVLVLAEQIAPAAPAVLDFLRTELRRQWPPLPTQPLWGEQPVDLHRFDIQQIAERVRELVLRSGNADPPAATRLLLTVAALASAYLDERHLDNVLRGIGNLAVPGGRLETEKLFSRRDQILDVVVAWARDEFTASSTDPRGHGRQPRGSGRPAATARVLMSALRPFLTPVIESTSMGTRDAADVLVLKNSLLPNNPRTPAGLTNAADAVAMLANQLDVRDERCAGVLRHLVNLPRELLGIGARGLPHADALLPAYARRALADAAATIRGAVAGRWDDMPLWARHAAAAASVHGTGGSGRTLAQRATAGDVVAAAARNDDELARMIVLLPIERDLHAYVKGGPGWERTAKRRHTAAVALARQLPWPEALDLLEASRDVNDDLVGDSPRYAFAEELGRHIDDPAQANALLERLASSAAIPGEREVLAALLQTQPHVVTDRLLAACTTWRGAELGLATLPHLEPGPVQDAVLDAAHDLVVATVTDVEHKVDKRSASVTPQALLGAATQVRRRLAENIRYVHPSSIGSMLKTVGSTAIATGRVLRAGPGATFAASLAALRRTREAAATAAAGVFEALPAQAVADEVPTNDRDAAYALGSQLAMALLRSTGDVEARTARLIALGLEGPPDLVPRVLQLATYELRRPTSGDDVIVVSPAQMAGLVRVLQRRLLLSDDIRLDLETDDDTAYAVAALIEVCPDELADLVTARLLGSTPHGGLWPFAWRDAVGSLEPAARAPFAAALRARLDAARTVPPLDDQVHAFYVDQVLGRIAAGTDGWPETLMGWAQGGPADRRRAAASVAKAWWLPVWTSVVSALLAAGVDREDRDVLLRGIEIATFGPDITEQAERRLEALRQLEPADDPAVQEFKSIGSSRVKAAVDDYQQDAELRRRGYR